MLLTLHGGDWWFPEDRPLRLHGRLTVQEGGAGVSRRLVRLERYDEDRGGWLLAGRDRTNHRGRWLVETQGRDGARYRAVFRRVPGFQGDWTEPRKAHLHPLYVAPRVSSVVFPDCRYTVWTDDAGTERADVRYTADITLVGGAWQVEYANRIPTSGPRPQPFGADRHWQGEPRTFAHGERLAVGIAFTADAVVEAFRREHWPRRKPTVTIHKPGRPDLHAKGEAEVRLPATTFVVTDTCERVDSLD